MGYWGKHPMSGDVPLDAKDELYGILKVKDPVEANTEAEAKEFQKEFVEKLLPNLDKVLENPFVKEAPFVIPFLIVRYGITIKDKIIVERLKGLIGDGGAEERGYDIEPSTRENGYNNFKSPYDYARQLEDNWEDLMNQDIKFDTMQREKGLLETMFCGE